MSMKQRFVAVFMLLAGSALAAGLVVGAFHANDESAHESSDTSASADHSSWVGASGGVQEASRLAS